ncbi:MAG: PEP-CTERM sorting domain-containing protein [Pseudomonadota bacterium]
MPIRFFVTIFALLVSTTAQPAIITYGTYSHDTDTNVVIGGGLEWLRWNHESVLGKSWNEVSNNLSSIEDGGWRLATNYDMQSLFNSFDFGIVFDSNPSTKQLIEIDGRIEAADNIFSFIQLFGDTSTRGIDVTSAEISYPPIYSEAIFGDIETGMLNRALVREDFYTENITNQGIGYAKKVAVMQPQAHSFDYSFQYYGIALVRSVPEPPLYILFCLGLAGLLAAKRKVNSLPVRGCS